ncbi:MAG: amidase [Deltaproteobacteria bacterium]|nr:amidase [Deltaproteobacteria bacterium]
MKTLPPDPIQQLGIAQFGIRLRHGEITSEAVTRQYLERIAALNPKLGAYVYIAENAAVETARGIDRLVAGGTDLGPLMGVPVAVKDIFAVEGMPTKAGSKMDISELVPPEGNFIKALKRSGCVILGKTRTIEFAAGAQNVKHPTPWNPWDSNIHRTPGGSSSGSAVALAAGLCAFAIGTDTGGSIRLPAALCGVFGLKPSVGLWPMDGVFPLCPAMDTIGLMTNSASDAALICGTFNDKTVQYTRPLEGLRLGKPENHFFDNLDPQIQESIQYTMSMLNNSGIQFESIEFPEVEEVVELFSKMVPADLVTTLGRKRFFKERDILDPVLIDRLSTALDLSAVEYIRLVRRQNELTQIGAKRIEGLDGWICPTTPVLPVPVSLCESVEAASSFTFKALQNTRPANIFGYCSSTLPLKWQGSDLPIGVQLHCGPNEEAQLLSISLAVEQLVGTPQKPDITKFI